MRLKRLRAQIFVRADGRRFQLRVLGLKRPADERGEMRRQRSAERLPFSFSLSRV